jgi:hypothetical protein
MRDSGGPRLLVAQFFQQQVSFAGSAQRDEINRSDLDLYMVYSGRSLRWWITSDMNLGINEANHNNTPASATISYGRGLRRMFGDDRQKCCASLKSHSDCGIDGLRRRNL